MKNRVFNPKEMEKKGKIIESYFLCPKVMSLTHASSKEGFTEIRCQRSIRHDSILLYVPQQTDNYALNCHEYRNARYFATRVSKDPGGESSFWLVTCSYNQSGYLLSIDAFTEEDVPTPAQCAEMSAVAA